MYWHIPTATVKYAETGKQFVPVIRIVNDEEKPFVDQPLNDQPKPSRQKAINFAREYIKKLSNEKQGR